MMQSIIVTLVVAYAAWAVVKRYAPQVLRRTVLLLITHLAKRVGWHRLASQLAPKDSFSVSCGGGCGPCGGCGTRQPSSAERAPLVFSAKNDRQPNSAPQMER